MGISLQIFVEGRTTNKRAVPVGPILRPIPPHRTDGLQSNCLYGRSAQTDRLVWLWRLLHVLTTMGLQGSCKTLKSRIEFEKACEALIRASHSLSRPLTASHGLARPRTASHGLARPRTAS